MVSQVLWTAFDTLHVAAHSSETLALLSGVPPSPTAPDAIHAHKACFPELFLLRGLCQQVQQSVC